MPRIVPTPIAHPAAAAREGTPRRVVADVLAATLPGPARDRLAQGAVLAVTTGQQPGLFTGPLYTIYKALSAIALARRLERDRRVAVVPVFWVAGDDHDFAEANHTWVLDAHGELAEVRLRERPPEAPLLPLARERCGPEITTALAALRAAIPETEFTAGVLDWLAAAYRPEATLADAFADALHALLGPRGLVVLRAHDRHAKRAAVPVLLKALAVTLPDSYTPVLLEARLGRDRLRPEGDTWVTRRSGERFTRADLERIGQEEPERLSPNVLLRPVVEAALLPTVAYAAGPAELGYLPEAAPLYAVAGLETERQTPVPRWSGVLVEGRTEKLLARHGLTLPDFDGRAGELETRLVREALPPETVTLLAALRQSIGEQYARLAPAVERVDPTLGRSVESARNSALAATQEIERKLLASLKRENETLVRQLGRARATLAPRGEAQERVLTVASFLVRYGPGLLDALEREVARWADVS
jgi:uncharacterized protein YllA (UPF0747 family)